MRCARACGTCGGTRVRGLIEIGIQEWNGSKGVLITKQSLQYRHYSKVSKCKAVSTKKDEPTVTVTVLYNSENAGSRRMYKNQRNKEGGIRIYWELVGVQ